MNFDPGHGAAPSDALVVFGATEDLAHKKIFPALYAMCKRGALQVPVVCAAAPVRNIDTLRARAPDSVMRDDAHCAASEDANYLRFHLSPHSTIALAARVKRAGKEFAGDQREFRILEQAPGEQTPYERLLSDAMNGDRALFARENTIESAWAVVAPVLDGRPPSLSYSPGSWGLRGRR